jgi:hypothetical protein
MLAETPPSGGPRVVKRADNKHTARRADNAQ